MYQVNRLLNNTTSTNMFNAAVNSNGSRIIVADTHLPDLSTGTPIPQTGSFKVYDVKYTADMRVSSMSQVGQTVIGTTDESLGTGVGISGDGSLVLATSNTEVFKVYSYNRATSNWDVIFAAGATSNLDSEAAVSILGIRYDVDFTNIITANVSPEGNTRLVYHVKQDSTWVCPTFSTDSVLLERYSRIRGLWISDYNTFGVGGAVVVHFQAANPESNPIRLLVTRFNGDSFSDYGFVTEFSSDFDPNDYKSISVTINRKGSHIGVSYYRDNKVHLKIYAVDVDLNWNMVKKFSFALDTPNSDRSSAVIFDDSIVTSSSDGSGGIPGKMMIAVTSGFSSDKFYGIYTNSCHPVTHEYSTSQDVSFGQRLDSLSGNAAELLSFAGTISKDFKVVLAAFAGPVVEPSSGMPFGPAHYPSFPAEGISNVGDFNSESISLALLVKGDNELSPSPSCHVPCHSPTQDHDCDDRENTTITIRTSKHLNLTLSTS